jgi:hypothetical protein
LMIVFGISISAFTQVKTVIIENGRAINDTLFNKRMFFLENFVDSRLTLKDGSVYSAKANIVTIDQYVVIIVNGDTLRTVEGSDITIFSGGEALIYKIDGYYHQIIETGEEFSLAMTKAIHFEGERLTGAYGGSNETSAITKFSPQKIGIGNGWLWTDENRVEMKYRYKELLFLILNGKRYPATKKNFEKLLSRRKADITRFINDNNINMSDNNDVIRLFRYLTGEE